MISSPQVLPDSSRTCPSQRSASVWSIRPYFWNRCPLLTTRRKSHPGLSPVFICIELNKGQARRKRGAAFLQKADNSTPKGSALFVVVVASVRFDSGCLVLGVNLSGMSVDG
ncbi:hypothetical protein CDAR_613871 [Caerostris darwini]|uniref:Uncharacterized protein n=1 Tax=Caerostris darwini TaxID=1538125 RepID=A0AAV4MIR0_9ARAC|nr:hypothetical protein CDAR_613871 [Caerostris darwini]